MNGDRTNGIPGTLTWISARSNSHYGVQKPRDVVVGVTRGAGASRTGTERQRKPLKKGLRAILSIPPESDPLENYGCYRPSEPAFREPARQHQLNESQIVR